MSSFIKEKKPLQMNIIVWKYYHANNEMTGCVTFGDKETSISNKWQWGAVKKAESTLHAELF